MTDRGTQEQEYDPESWPTSADKGKGKARDSASVVWQKDLMTDQEVYLSSLNDKLHNLRQASSSSSSTSPSPQSKRSDQSSAPVYRPSTTTTSMSFGTSPGESIISDSGDDNGRGVQYGGQGDVDRYGAMGDGDRGGNHDEDGLQDGDNFTPAFREVDGGRRKARASAGPLASHEADKVEEEDEDENQNDPGYPLLARKESDCQMTASSIQDRLPNSNPTSDLPSTFSSPQISRQSSFAPSIPSPLSAGEITSAPTVSRRRSSSQPSNPVRIQEVTQERSVSGSKPHINFAPRVRITSGIKVPPTPSPTKPNPPDPSTQKPTQPPNLRTTPSASHLASFLPFLPSRQNSFSLLGSGSQGDTGSIASSMSASLRTVPIHTWLFSHSNGTGGGRDTAGGVERGRGGFVDSGDLPGPSATILTPSAIQSKDYFSINPHPNQPRQVNDSSPVTYVTSPADMERERRDTPLEYPSSSNSRSSSFSFSFSRANSIQTRHTQEEEQIEAEAARRRADVMLFETPYMRSYSSVIRQEDLQGLPSSTNGSSSPRGYGTTEQGSSSRKSQTHTIVRIKSEEDVIWGEDRWVKWRNWKWWVWKVGKWWKSFGDFWCGVEEEEEVWGEY